MAMRKIVQKMYECKLVTEGKFNNGLTEYNEEDYIEPIRDVKNIQEYEFLFQSSQRKLMYKASPNNFWIEGYVIGIQPIRSMENFHYFEWSLENGEFLTTVFAITDGLNENYLNFLSMVDVKPKGIRIPAEVLVKKCNLYVKKKVVDRKMTYQIQFITPWLGIVTTEDLNRTHYQFKALTNGQK